MTWFIGPTVLAPLRVKAALEAAESRGFPGVAGQDIKEGKGTFKALPQRSELPATLNEGLVIELVLRDRSLKHARSPMQSRWTS